MNTAVETKIDSKKVAKLVKSVVAQAIKKADEEDVKPKSIMQIYNEVGSWGFTVEKIVSADHNSILIKLPLGTIRTVVGLSSYFPEDCVKTDLDHSLKSTRTYWRLVK